MDYGKAYGQIHKSEKRFPGYSIAPYVGQIGALVAQAKATHERGPFRLLDYGCGKGYQYLVRRYHEQWGVLPHCYDIGIPQLARKPEGRFEGVICTDVLEHIERADLPGILDELVAYTQPKGFLFLGISCRPSRKRLPDQRDVHVTVEPPSWWISLLCEHLAERSDLHVAAVFDHGDPPHFADQASVTSWKYGE